MILSGEEQRRSRTIIPLLPTDGAYVVSVSREVASRADLETTLLVITNASDFTAIMIKKV